MRLGMEAEWMFSYQTHYMKMESELVSLIEIPQSVLGEEGVGQIMKTLCILPLPN